MGLIDVLAQARAEEDKARRYEAEAVEALAAVKLEAGDHVRLNGDGTASKVSVFDKKYITSVGGAVAGFDTREQMDEAFSMEAHRNRAGIYPTEFKVLILPDAVEEVTKGGIIRPTMTTDTEKYATIEGRIIAVSHLAFTYATDEEWGDAKPQPGNRVIFAKYAGVRHKAKDGQEYLLVNDKDIVAVVE